MPAACAFSRAGQFGPEGVARDMIRISTIFIAICMVLVAASLGLVLYSVAGISGIGIRDRGADRADLPDPLQRGVDAAARPHRCRRPDRGPVARHRRPRPPGRRIRPPARRRRGPGGVGEFRRRRPHPDRGRRDQRTRRAGQAARGLGRQPRRHAGRGRAGRAAAGPRARRPREPQNELPSSPRTASAPPPPGRHRSPAAAAGRRHRRSRAVAQPARRSSPP